jgi:5'-nucleotidase / UDP-sugar diphosphatase
MTRGGGVWRFRGILAAASLLTLLGGGRLLHSAAPAVVTIVHFNDAHEMDAADNGRSGGMARVATLADRLRKTHSPLLLTLGGDFLSPAAIGTARVDGEPLAGRQAVAVLNVMGVQWATLGNHEFDVSEAAFHQRLAESTFGIVSSNVVDAQGQPFKGTVPSTVVPIRVAGRTIRLGLIGLTIDFNRRPWVTYLPAVAAARAQIDKLKGQSDAIVALTHLGLAGDEALAIGVPEIDLILGGHEHDNWILRRGPAATPIAKADANGRSAIVATLTFGAPGARPAVDTRLEILNTGAGVAPQPRVQAEVAKWMQLGFAAFRQDGLDPEAAVATISTPLDGREATVRNRPGDLTNLIVAAMAREAGPVDVAVLNGGSVRIDDVLLPGPVRQYDIIRILPFGGKVVRATLEGALLGSILEAGLANQGSGGYLHTLGVTREGSAWIVRGKPLDPAGRYRVALPEFLLTGGESRMKFLTRDNPQVSDVHELRDVRLAVVDEFKARQ